MAVCTSSTSRTSGSRPRSGHVPLIALAATIAACGSPAPLFPEGYAATYVEVRDCRRSPDHDLNYIRVVVAPEAVEPYMGRSVPFPVGAVVVKEEYFDDDCTELEGFTAMRKEAPGAAPELGDWSWQRLTADAKVIEETDLARCAACHSLCLGPPAGHDYTCADP